MPKALNKRQRTLDKVTSQAFLLASGIVIVATLGFALAFFSGQPIEQSEGMKLLWVYAGFGVIGMLRWLVVQYQKKPEQE
jgi:cytochrome bd-type quinol oxidase subunit 2